MNATGGKVSSGDAWVPTTLGELQIGDHVPGWHGLCEVTETQLFEHGRARITFVGEGDAGMELGPADTVWMRTPRTGEAPRA